MCKNLSAKCHKENKEKLIKKALEDIKIFLRKKKEKSKNMGVNVTKISEKDEK